jgi:hypothetical protein
MSDNKMEIILSGKDISQQAFNSFKANIEGATKSIGSLESIAAKVAVAFGLFKVAEFTKDATMAAARYETLGVVLERLGKNTSYTQEEMKGFEEGLRKTGIAGIEARQVMAQMIQSNLDLGKSTQLARVAQDAAVIGDMNSSEAMLNLMHAVQAGSVEITRNMGLTVSFDQAHRQMAASLGKTVEQLTEQEKTTARMNAVLKAGVQISGAYEAAMGTAGKQINSFKRYVQDFEVEFGKAFNPALTQIVFGASEAMKTLTEAVKDPKFQADMTKMANDISQNLVVGMKWLVDNRDQVKGYFTGIASGMSSIATAMGKLPPEAWGAILGYAVAGPAGAAIGAGSALGMRITEPDRRNYGQVLQDSIAENEKKLAFEESLMDAKLPNQAAYIEGLKNTIQLEKDLLAVYLDQGKAKAPVAEKVAEDSDYASRHKYVQAPGEMPLSKEAQNEVEKFWADYRKEVEGEFEFEKFKLEEQKKEYQKFVTDKAALDRWYRAEKRKIDIKEFAATAGTQFPSEAYDIESMRAKSYGANQAAQQAYGQSVEEQRAAIAKADQMANDERWWQTYVEGIDDATRANEIFKESMNIMSQSFADAFAGFVTGTKTAKEAFQGMVQSVIAGMVRMATQSTSEQLMGLLFKAGSSLAAAYGGGSTPTGMGSGAGVPWGGQTGDWGAVMHSGGAVGSGSGPYREMPAWMIATAPRLHGGLAPDEFPAVLQRGERVIAKGKSGSTNNVTINVAAPGGRMDRESLNHLQTALFASLQRAGQRNS